MCDYLPKEDPSTGDRARAPNMNRNLYSECLTHASYGN